MSPISVLQFYFSNVTLSFRYTHGQPELDYLFKPSLQLGMTKESPWDGESESASRFWELSLKENLRIIKQKTSEEAEDLNNTTDQSDLTIYRTLHPTTTEWAFFSNGHGIFSRIDLMVSYKIDLNKFKKTEIIPIIFSYHNRAKLQTNSKGKTGKFTNMWKLNNILLNTQWVIKEITSETRKWKCNIPKSVDYNKSSTNRQVDSSKCLHFEKVLKSKP